MFNPLPIPTNPPTQWLGDLPVTSRYTYGLALEKFFLALKEEGKILGSRCFHCRKTYVPLTQYCPKCLAELTEVIDVGLQGELYSYTVLYKNLDGTRRESPEIIGYIKIADGGLIHRIEGVPIETLHIGTLVAAQLKPKEERIGSILDIRSFIPLSEEQNSSRKVA